MSNVREGGDLHIYDFCLLFCCGYTPPTFGLIVRKHRASMRVSITIMRQWNQINDAISEEWKLNIIAAMSCESKGRLCFNHIFMTEKREVLHCTLALWYHTIIHHILGLNALTRIYPERALGQPEIVLEARNWESGDCAVKNPEHQSICSNPETGERKCLPVKYKQVFFFNK